MKAEVQTTQLMLPDERQHLLLRALVGSLVLCAALAPTTAAQSIVLAARGRTTMQGEAVVLRFQRALPQHLHDCKLAHAYQHSAARAQAVATTPHNMLASASGKRLSLQLEMSRAQAGNLQHQQHSIP